MKLSIDVRAALAGRLEGLQSVVGDLVRELMADGRHTAEMALQIAIASELTRRANNFDLDVLKRELAEQFPDDERVQDIERAGYHEEYDYVWARGPKFVRSCAGTIAYGNGLYRINGRSGR